MSEERKYIILRIVFVLIICIFFIWLFTQQKEPKEIIKENFGFSLPATYQILHFNGNVISGDMDAKILIKETNVDKIRKDVLNYFGDECSIEDFSIPNIGRSIKWWDVDQGNIISFFVSFMEGDTNSILPGPKSIEKWVFLVQQKDGKFYLYMTRF